jgi:DoxX-like protein
MQSDLAGPTDSKAMFWGGWILSGLPALFLLFGGVMNLVKPDVAAKGTVELGYPESVIGGLGVVLLASTVLYLIRQTSVVGAILLTGYLGGAVASHLRVGQSWFTILFPAVFGALLWGGLCLRDRRVRSAVFG